MSVIERYPGLSVEEAYRRNDYANSIKWKRKKYYGLTDEQYKALIVKQGNKCAICGNPPRLGRSLDIDRCHDTNTVRGLLCNQCNLAIGKFQHNPETLMKAVNYLYGK